MTAISASTNRSWFQRVRDSGKSAGEVGFWRPTDARPKDIRPGEVWFFKELGAPLLLGYGRFVRYQTTTPSQIWKEFGPACGATSESQLIADLSAIRKHPTSGNTTIGNVVLSDFTAFPVAVPISSVDLPNLFNRFSYVRDGHKVFELVVKRVSITPPLVGLEQTSRRELATEVFARNTGHVAYIRNLYKGLCQVTGEPVLGGAGGDLTQVHHIDFLCKGGADHPSNMMSLSPDWHALAHAPATKFDWGTLEFVIEGKRHKLAVNRHLNPRKP